MMNDQSFDLLTPSGSVKAALREAKVLGEHIDAEYGRLGHTVGLWHVDRQNIREIKGIEFETAEKTRFRFSGKLLADLAELVNQVVGLLDDDSYLWNFEPQVRCFSDHVIALEHREGTIIVTDALFEFPDRDPAIVQLLADATNRCLRGLNTIRP